MYHLAGVKIKPGGEAQRKLKINGLDSESLLVSFLEELLWIGENENIAFDHFNLTIDELHLSAQLTGGEILSLSKEIKAVTYHNMLICSTEVGLRVRIVFDV
jgi:SHS2 domain-containing protein